MRIIIHECYCCETRVPSKSDLSQTGLCYHCNVRSSFREDMFVRMLSVGQTQDCPFCKKSKSTFEYYTNGYVCMECDKEKWVYTSPDGYELVFFWWGHEIINDEGSGTRRGTNDVYWRYSLSAGHLGRDMMIDVINAHWESDGDEDGVWYCADWDKVVWAGTEDALPDEIYEFINDDLKRVVKNDLCESED